jgi:hypothetical protein
MTGSDQQARNLEDILDALHNDTEDESISLEEVRDAIGHRAFGPLLLTIGAINISPIGMIPGIWWFTATMALLIAFQLLIKADEPWLPQSILSKEFKRDALKQADEKLRPWAKRVDSVIKPRMAWMTQAPSLQIIALLAMTMALITYPLSLLPGAGFFPGLALLLLGLGLTVRDGYVLIAGIVFSITALGLLVWAIPNVVGLFIAFGEVVRNWTGQLW